MAEKKHKDEVRVAVVGPCVSGKSELVRALRAAGYEARHVAQEHSYAPAMWQQISAPDLLIYLDVDYPTAKARRPRITWGPDRLADEGERLAHARGHARRNPTSTENTSVKTGRTLEEIREEVWALRASWEAAQER